MTPDRISELLAPFLGSERLSSAQLDQIHRYLDLLLRWNAKMNLTAVREPEQIITRHFGESFFLAATLFPEAAASGFMIDVGSGAGFPGIPAKILRPAITLTLVEAQYRKAIFLRETFRAIAAEGNVLSQRAEDLDPTSTQADVVSLRAVEKFEAVLPLASRLVRPGGRLALLIGSAQVPRAKELVSGFLWEPQTPVPGSNSRVLLVGNQAG